jgi:hypothetical protein
MPSVFLFCVVLALAGCASQRAVLVNAQGEEATCETSGSGFFGAVSVTNQQDKCIAEAEKRGYHLQEQKN